MNRVAALAVAIAIAAVGSWPHAVATVGRFSEVTLVPGEGVSFEVGNRSYSGELRISGLSDGLALVEEVGLDGYLAGIREVPATWPEAALDAQAVAARTYLAWTLSRGRSNNGKLYDFDICATTQCQVYAGIGAGEPRWVDAVTRTAGEILLYEGSPAQAMYSSTSGGQTEPIQDVFAGASPRPYLAGADSPDETSPYVDWTVSMPAKAFVDVLAAAGFAIGELVSVDVLAPPRGDGVWELEVVSSEGSLRVPVSRVRSAFNRHGPDLYPDILPNHRPDGRLYPQTILSYRFDVRYVALASLDSFLRALPVDDRPIGGSIVFEGHGWGHHVGMSQYGALAMAEKGEGYASILGHYYGGLQPQVAHDVLPGTVEVGLRWGRESIVILASGPFTIVTASTEIAVVAGGPWIFQASDDDSAGVTVISGDLLLDRLFERFSGRIPIL
jgi:stage II sporulation protein D